MVTIEQGEGNTIYLFYPEEESYTLGSQKIVVYENGNLILSEYLMMMRDIIQSQTELSNPTRLRYTYEYPRTTIDEATVLIEIRHSRTDELVASATFVYDALISSWTIGSKTVKSLEINNKTVKSIVRTSDNALLYTSSPSQDTVVEDILVIEFSGTEFVSNNYTGGENYGIVGSDMSIDWGDGTIEELQSEKKFTHTYENSGNHTITITGNITEIGDYAFYHTEYDDGIQSIDISQMPNLTTIGTGAFYRCRGLTTFTIPSTVTNLGQSAFRYCSHLRSVSVPTSITSMSTTFRNCTSLIDYQLYWNDPPVTWANTLMPNNTNTYFIIPYGSKNNYIAKSFPSDKLIERDILTIVFEGTEFLSNNREATRGLVGNYMSIDWGDGTIESLASTTQFSHTYEEGGSHTINISGKITDIGSYAFYFDVDNGDIKSVNLSQMPNLTRIATGAFYHRIGLTTINIPSSVTTIEQSAFRYCTGLTSVSIPSSVTTVGNYIFRNCTKIVDYQLYWTDPPVSWATTLMPNNTNAYYTIPNGTTANYVAKSFPSAKLIERSP